MDLLISVNDKYSSFVSSQYDRDDLLSLFLSAEQLSSMIFLKTCILFNWVRQCWAPIISLGWYFVTGYAFPGFYLFVLNPILLCLVIEIQSCYTVLSSFCYERVLVQIVKEKVNDFYVTWSFHFSILVDQSMLYLRINSNDFPASVQFLVRFFYVLAGLSSVRLSNFVCWQRI